MVELDVSITTSSVASKSKISQWTNLQVIALGVLWRHMCILYKFTAPNQTSAVGFFLLKRTSSTGFDSFKKIGASSHPHAGLSLVLPILKSCSSGSDAFFQIQKPLGPKPGSVPWKHYTDFKGPLRVVSGIAFTLEIPVKSRCLKIQKSKVPNGSWGSPIDFRGYHAGFFNKYLPHVRMQVFG